MQKIMIEKPVAKIVVSGTKQVEAYQASDGKIFEGWTAEQECKNYEIRLSFKSVMDKVLQKQTFIDYGESFPNTWFYAGTQEELEAIKNYLDIDSNKFYLSFYPDSAKHNLIGQWIGVIVEYNDNGKDTLRIFTWDWVSSQIKNYLKEFGEQ